MTLHGDRWWNRTNVLIDINPLIAHPAHERLYYTTGVYTLYPLRTAVWVLLRPTKIKTVKELWDGSYGFLGLIRRRLECLTICRCHNIPGSSRFTINLHDFTFSLASRGSQYDRKEGRPLAVYTIYCFYVRLTRHEVGIFVSSKSIGSQVPFVGKKRRGGGGRSRGTTCSCSFFFVVCAWLAPSYLFSGHREEKMWQSPGTGNSFHVIINQPRDV